MTSAIRNAHGALLFSGLFLASTAFAGPIWDGDLEADAKQSASTAQVVTTEGSVLQIKGQLTGTALQGGGDFIDMYLVRITAPAILSISTAGGDSGGFAQFDSRMFLFRAVQTQSAGLVAQGIFANDNAATGNFGALLTNSANDGSQFVLNEEGFYFIAIANSGVSALNPNGAPMWPDLDVPGLRSFAGFQPFQNWGGDPSSNVGTYEIRLSGVSGVPAPGALALLGLVGLAGRRRRA